MGEPKKPRTKLPRPVSWAVDRDASIYETRLLVSEPPGPWETTPFRWWNPLHWYYDVRDWYLSRRFF